MHPKRSFLNDHRDLRSKHNRQIGRCCSSPLLDDQVRSAHPHTASSPAFSPAVARCPPCASSRLSWKTVNTANITVHIESTTPAQNLAFTIYHFAKRLPGIFYYFLREAFRANVRRNHAGPQTQYIGVQLQRAGQ